MPAYAMRGRRQITYWSCLGQNEQPDSEQAKTAQHSHKPSPITCWTLTAQTGVVAEANPGISLMVAYCVWCGFYGPVEYVALHFG